MRSVLLAICLLAWSAGCAPEEKREPYPTRTLTDADRRYLRQRGIRNYEGQQARKTLWERDFAREEVKKAQQRHRERFQQP